MASVQGKSGEKTGSIECLKSLYLQNFITHILFFFYISIENSDNNVKMYETINTTLHQQQFKQIVLTLFFSYTGNDK